MTLFYPVLHTKVVFFSHAGFQVSNHLSTYIVFLFFSPLLLHLHGLPSFQARRPHYMGNPPSTDVPAFASDALDARRVGHHVHEPVRRALPLPLPPSVRSWRCSITNTPKIYSVFSAFFRKGQVIETFRGEGIYQPAIDLAIEKLRAGAWVRPVLLFIIRVTDCDLVLKCPFPVIRTRMKPPITRFTFLERAKSANLTRTRRIRKRGSRDCNVLNGECELPLTFFRPPSSAAFAQIMNVVLTRLFHAHALLDGCHHGDPAPFSGRMLMETPHLPTIIPMWITGTTPIFLYPHNKTLTKSDPCTCPNPFAKPLRRPNTP
jgi:hypothetical protein